MYAYSPFSPHNDITTGMYLSHFTQILIATLIFHGIITHLLLLYRLPYFVFYLLVIFVFSFKSVLTF
jgi:hypothetical protein